MRSLLRYLFLIFTSVLSMTISYMAWADGGIGLGATRVIYPADARQVSLPVINHSVKDRYLINSWIENGNNKKDKHFVVTPPLFVSEPNSEHTLRLVYLGDALPQDRESVFWVNVKAIPAINKQDIEGKNVLQLAILSRIKLFLRPASLGSAPENLSEMLSFKLQNNQLTLTNPSAYFISVVNLKVGSRSLQNIMVPPKGSASVSVPRGVSGQVTFQTVNDYGGVTAIKTAKH